MQAERIAIQRGVALKANVPLVGYLIDKAVDAVRMIRVRLCAAARFRIQQWYVRGRRLGGIELCKLMLSFNLLTVPEVSLSLN